MATGSLNVTYEQPLGSLEERRGRFNSNPRVSEGLQGVSINIKDLHLSTRQKLCRKLDITINGVEGDFKTLAGYIDMPNDDFQLISQGQQPTENVLRWWERKPEATIAKLRNILLTMGRSDCVDILDQAPGPVIDSTKKQVSNFFEDVDKEIGNLPHPSQLLLEVLVQKICETQDISVKQKCEERIETVLDWVFQHFSDNACGIYSAEKILRKFLVSDRNPENVMSCIRPYTCILTVMIKHGPLPAFNKDSLKPLLKYLKELVNPPRFCPQSRTRRDIETVIEILSASAENLNWPDQPVKFVNNCVESGEICQKLLKKKAWYQHFLILALLHMQVLTQGQEKNIFLQRLLQVIAFLSKNLSKQHPSYQWKFTVTVVDGLTKIATNIPDLAKITVIGENGLVEFFEMLKSCKLSDCIAIFHKYARHLVFVDNIDICRELLTGIYKDLDVDSEEILKDRFRSSRLGCLANSKAIHNGENTLILSGTFQGSKVVAKCYKPRRQQLTKKYLTQRAKNENLANEESVLSYLKENKCHSNIVQLITYDTTLSCIVLKYVSAHGCLLKFLRNRRTAVLSPKLTDLLHMMIQIADALGFLEGKQIIHLGIKAKNVLVDENYHVKLTGFQSSSRKKFPEGIKVKIENRHLKWMDPDYLSGGLASYATDIWAFGVLMYEFLTFGCVPYNNLESSPNHGAFKRKAMTASQARLFVLRGGRLPKHSCIPKKVFEIMSVKCFEAKHYKRPSATEVKNSLQTELSNLQEEMAADWQPTPPPPRLCFLQEDVNPNDRNPGTGDNNIMDQDEDFPFTHLDVMDLDWNQKFSESCDDIYNKEMYTNESVDSNSTKPFLCIAREDNQDLDSPPKFVVLEHKEFRDICLAEKLRVLNHETLVGVLAVNRFGPDKLEIISQSFSEGNVLNALLSSSHLRQNRVLYIKQAASGVIYLHKHGILHGDLRAENLLLVNEHLIKVGRWGVSKLEEDVNGIYSNEQLQKDIPDARWNSAEVVKYGAYSKESDYWSFGVLCWELFKATTYPTGTGKEAVLPYKDLRDDQVYRAIEEDGDRLPNPDTRSALHGTYCSCWEKIPSERRSIYMVLREVDSIQKDDYGTSAAAAVALVSQAERRTGIRSGNKDHDEHIYVNINDDILPCYLKRSVQDRKDSNAEGDDGTLQNESSFYQDLDWTKRRNETGLYQNLNSNLTTNPLHDQGCDDDGEVSRNLQSSGQDRSSNNGNEEVQPQAEPEVNLEISNNEDCSNDESNVETESLPSGDFAHSECIPGCVKSIVDRWEKMHE